MKRLILIGVLFLLFLQTLNSQWVSNYGGNTVNDNPLTNAKGLAVTTDANGYCYVAGFSYDVVTNNDILVIKYLDNGDTAWVRTLDGGCYSDDKAYGIVVDAEGSVYIVGAASITGLSYEVVVAKYNSLGELQWNLKFGETTELRDDRGLDIAVSQSGFIYVTGYTTGEDGKTNILVQKYDKFQRVWSVTLEGEDHLNSKGYGIVVDETDNIYITGYAECANGSNNIITAKLNSDGVTQWKTTDPNLYGGDNQATDLALDAENNVYVVGYAAAANGETDCKLIKYNNNGIQVWDALYNGTANSEDKGYGIVVDEMDNNVIITGFATNLYNSKDYITISYTLEGTRLWYKTYNGPVSGADRGNAIGLLNDGRIVVTGESKGYGGDFDFLTIKYSKAGTTLQISRYSMTPYSDDRAKDIAIDDDNSVYITGSSELLIDGPTTPSYLSTVSLEWGAPDVENLNPSDFVLSQNYPNPFNPVTNINLTVAKQSQVKVKIYDILGRLVQTLLDEYLTAGTYKITFNGSDLSSGTYFYEMTTENFRDVKKMLLIK